MPSTASLLSSPILWAKQNESTRAAGRTSEFSVPFRPSGRCRRPLLLNYAANDVAQLALKKILQTVMISRARASRGTGGTLLSWRLALDLPALAPFRNGSATARLDAALKYTTTATIIVDDTAVQRRQHHLVHRWILLRPAGSTYLSLKSSSKLLLCNCSCSSVVQEHRSVGRFGALCSVKLPAGGGGAASASGRGDGLAFSYFLGFF